MYKKKYTSWKSLKNAVRKGVEVNWKQKNYIVQYWGPPNNDYYMHSKFNDYNDGLFRRDTKEPIYNLKDFYTIQKNKKHLADIQGGDLPEVETAYKRTFKDKAKYFVKKNKYYFIGGASLLVLLLAYKKFKK